MPAGQAKMPFNHRGGHRARDFSAFYEGVFGRLVRFCGAAWLHSAKIQIPCYSSSFGLIHTFRTKTFTFSQHLLISRGYALLPFLAPKGQELDRAQKSGCQRLEGGGKRGRLVRGCKHSTTRSKDLAY